MKSICGFVYGKNTYALHAQPTPFKGSLVTDMTGIEQFIVIAVAGPSAAEQQGVLEIHLSRLE